MVIFLDGILVPQAVLKGCCWRHFFQSKLSNWDTRNVCLQGMFSGATSFNSNITNWNTGKGAVYGEYV